MLSSNKQTVVNEPLAKTVLYFVPEAHFVS